MARRLALLASLSVLGSLPGASLAEAAPTDELTCEVIGDAYPSPYLKPLIDGGLYDPLFPQHASITLSLSGQCAGVIGGQPATKTAYIYGDGDFYNYACDTGWWTDADGSGTYLYLAGVGSQPFAYEMELTRGNGVMKIGGPSANPHTGGTLGGAHLGAGIANATPNGHLDGCELSSSINWFNVIAAFTLRDPAGI